MHRVCLVAMLAIACASSGCTAVLSPMSGVPAHRLPPEFLAKPKNNLVPIDAYRLRQDPPRAYLLDSGDILGMWIQGVLGDDGSPIPFRLPEPDSDLPPSMGYPIIVAEDGTISLPHVPPIDVRGMTVRQVETLVRKAYTVDRQILAPGKDRIIVTVMRERTYRVVVLRRDGQGSLAQGQAQAQGQTQGRTSQNVVRLPAYQNDVLHALAATGGLPGVEVKNEVLVVKGKSIDAQRRDAFIRAFYSNPPTDPCMCFPPLPDDSRIIRIPLRLPPGHTPNFSPEDVILEDGDIVLIEGREREVYYTAGLLGGGEHPLPRDYDLDVIGAMALSGSLLQTGGRQGGGGGLGSGGFGGGGGGIGGGVVPPGQLMVLRKTPCGGQIIIEVDLNRAMNDPRSRPLVQAGDILVLRYRPEEEVTNFGIVTFFTYGIQEFIRNRD